MSTFFHIRAGHQEYHIARESVLHIETPGELGKQVGWIDEIAAVLSLTGGIAIGLNKEQWQQASEWLSIKPRHYNTGFDVTKPFTDEERAAFRKEWQQRHQP